MDQAHKTFRRLRGFSDAEVEDELHVMKTAIDSDRAAQAGMRFWHFSIKRSLNEISLLDQCSHSTKSPVSS